MNKQAAVMEDEAAQVSRLEGLASSTRHLGFFMSYTCLCGRDACGVYVGGVDISVLFIRLGSLLTRQSCNPSSNQMLPRPVIR